MSRFFTVLKTLNRLEEKEISKDEISKYPIVLEVSGNRYDTLYVDGEAKDIQIGNTIFSYLIEHSDWGACYMTFCMSDDEEFHASIRYGDISSSIVNAVYGMVAITSCDTYDEFRNLINPLLLANDPLIRTNEPSSTDERIAVFRAGKAFKAKIKDKYPFMIKIINKGLKYQLEKIRHDFPEFSED